MFILDSNVISETFRPSPAQSVIDWLESHPREEVFVTAMSEAETFRGIELMPAGRRRDELIVFAEGYFSIDLAGKILPFDARIAAARQRMGRRIQDFDAQIAAIARAHNATLATRNTKDFEHCGIRVIHPWLAR